MGTVRFSRDARGSIMAFTLNRRNARGVRFERLKQAGSQTNRADPLWIVNARGSFATSGAHERTRQQTSAAQAIVAIFHRLYLERRFGGLSAGSACLALILCNATMYYGEVIHGFLPVVQKVSLVSWVFWLVGLALMDSPAMKRGRSVEVKSRGDVSRQRTA